MGVAKLKYERHQRKKRDFNCSYHVILIHLVYCVQQIVSVLHYVIKVTLHYLKYHCFEFCLGTFAHVFPQEQCVLCSASRHKRYLYYLRLHRFEIHSSLELAHGFIMLRLTASRRCEAARWQLHEARCVLFDWAINKCFVYLFIFTSSLEHLLAKRNSLTLSLCP